MRIFPAHITEIDGVRLIQTVGEHSLNVAAYAAEKLEKAGLANTAYLSGILHDAGKFTCKYKDYIERAAKGEAVVRGSVNHTFCAVVYLMERYHANKPQSWETLTCELIAFAVGSHHGTFDCVNLDGENGFLYRVQKSRVEICYEEAITNFLSDFKSAEEIDKLFLLAVDEVTTLFARIKQKIGANSKTVSFLVGLAARMVLSALTDGDRRDTAEFMCGKKLSPKRADTELWKKCLVDFEERLSTFQAETPINLARQAFSVQCRTAGRKNADGIYRLSLPTGAGKTLSSLGYSLASAATFGKKRIIFVIPLLSILEQNSKVIRESIKDGEMITEHHSDFIKDFDHPEELDRYELLTQTWESPIIITTLVQLLNTFFSGKMSSVRRMSALTDSVIVIDEVQSVPRKAMTMFCMAVNYLVHCCGANIVFSSATQPCFEEINGGIKFGELPDIVPYDSALFSIFQRAKVVDMTSPYGMTREQLADFAQERAREVSSLLIICNTKNTARELYYALQQDCREYEVYHLSAAMCMQHRCDTLGCIHKALASRTKMICVATQIVEAGVDFSFQSVIRVIAGTDNIAQAAGRCNRNQDFDTVCHVYVVNLQAGAENLSMLKEIATAQRCAATLLYQYKNNAAYYDNDLLGTASVKAYYSLLLGDADTKKLMFYPASAPGARPVKLFELLSNNAASVEGTKQNAGFFLKQAFKMAGELFAVFDEQTTDIIVPYNDEADKIISDLMSEKAEYDYAYMKRTLERAKPYLIKIFGYQRRKLADDGMLYSNKDGHFFALNPLCYSKETGHEMKDFIL